MILCILLFKLMMEVMHWQGKLVRLVLEVGISGWSELTRMV